MTDLINRLGASCYLAFEDGTNDYFAAQEAIDRIEELVKERDEARHLQSCACNYDTPTDVCMGHHALFERLYAVEREKLEAKLAKAVAFIRRHIPDSVYEQRQRANAFLAELEGK